MSPLANEYVSVTDVFRAVQVPHREMLEDWGILCVFIGPGEWEITDEFGVKLHGFRDARPGDWIVKQGTKVLAIMTNDEFHKQYRLL
jgi:hypothetical protein